MKHLTGILFFGLVLSGCNSVYGTDHAPVVDLMHPQQNAIRQPSAPLFRAPPPNVNQAARPLPQQPPQQPIPPRAAPVNRPAVPPPVVNNQPQPVSNPYQSTPVPAPARPVALPPAAQTPPPAGWNVAPQSGNTVVIVDHPKVGKPTVPEVPVINRAKPLVDEPKLPEKVTPPTASAQKEVEAVKQATKEAVKPPPPAPKVQQPEVPTPAPAPATASTPKPAPAPEPAKPARPAPLRPKPASNTLEDAIVENNPRGEKVATRPPTNNKNNSGGGTAVSSLLRRASASLSSGNLDEAVAYLENAQRIDPRNSKILYDIANIRFHQGRYRDAENIAGKATQIGSGNMVKKSWRLISKAREALGDKQGALQAAEKAAQ